MFTYKNWSFLFFCAAVGKFLALGMSWSDLGLTLCLGSVVAFFQWKDNSEEMQKLMKRCDLMDAHLTQLYKNDEDVKTRLSAINLGQVRTANVGHNR